MFTKQYKAAEKTIPFLSSVCALRTTKKCVASRKGKIEGITRKKLQTKTIRGPSIKMSSINLTRRRQNSHDDKSPKLSAIVQRDEYGRWSLTCKLCFHESFSIESFGAHLAAIHQIVDAKPITEAELWKMNINQAGSSQPKNHNAAGNGVDGPNHVVIQLTNLADWLGTSFKKF